MSRHPGATTVTSRRSAPGRGQTTTMDYYLGSRYFDKNGKDAALRVRARPLDAQAFDQRAEGVPPATIKAGTTVRAAIPLRVSDLKYWDSTTHSWQWENGPVEVMVGGGSDSLPLKDTFTVMN